LRNLGRWRRVSKTNLRVWTLINFGREVFKFKAAEVKRADIRELVNEAVEKVVEFA
jgi:hypothetical protein